MLTIADNACQLLNKKLEPKDKGELYRELCEEQANELLEAYPIV